MQMSDIDDFRKSYDQQKQKHSMRRKLIVNRMNRSQEKEYIPKLRNPTLVRVLESDLHAVKKAQYEFKEKKDRVQRRLDYSKLVQNIYKPKKSNLKRLERELAIEKIKNLDTIKQRPHKEEFTELMNKIYEGSNRKNRLQNFEDQSITDTYDPMRSGASPNSQGIPTNRFKMSNRVYTKKADYPMDLPDSTDFHSTHEGTMKKRKDGIEKARTIEQDGIGGEIRSINPSRLDEISEYRQGSPILGSQSVVNHKAKSFRRRLKITDYDLIKQNYRKNQ